jgi:SAM-dependent methyltransferase
MSTVLTRQAARRAYNRIGSIQDTQGFYEDRATDALVRHADFGAAADIYEFGCGTGRFARRLLDELLSPSARYRGVDISPRMVALAQARLAPYSARAQVSLTEGEPPTGEPSDCCDRFVSNYVFDLLSEDDILAVMEQAHRMLRPQGLLCLTGMSTGVGPFSRLVAGAWNRVQARWPSLVGGCRGIDVRPLLPACDWQLLHHEKIVAFGITSEVLVARCLKQRTL